MTNSDMDSLKALADEVCTALHSYVAVLAGGVEPERVLPAMDTVQAAAHRFVELSITETGWGTPFLPSPFADEVDEDAHTGEQTGTDDQYETVEISLNYLVRCLDPQLARQVVDDRLREAATTAPEDEIDSISGILQTLESIDGWDPQRYEASSRRPFEVLEKSWSFG